MKHKRIYIIIASVALIVGFALPAKPHDFEVDGIYYNITSSTDKTVAVTYLGSSYISYENEYTGDVVIPTQVSYSGTTYSVSSIGDCAFRGCSGLTSVTIPNSVIDIGESAFEGCNGLTSVIFGNAVTKISKYAFYGCTGLTSVTIPDSVTEIGGSAFSGCSGLTNVTFNATNCTSMGGLFSTVFGYCTNLKIINIGNNVKSIPNYAFCNCNGLTSVTIPNSVIEIGEYAFESCTGLTSVTIPDSVTSIGDNVFQCTGLTSVIIGNSVTKIGRYAFYCCTCLTSVTIGNSVMKIDQGAFEYCTDLTSVTIPDSVTEIGSSAFGDCTSLTTLVIGNSLTNIDAYMFNGCTNLTSVTIGDSVTKIPDKMFYNYKNLETVTIGKSVASIADNAFAGCTGLTAVNVKDLKAWCNVDIALLSNPLDYAGNLYLNGKLVKDLIIPEGVVAIKNYVFSGCKCLTSVTIPNSVTKIGNGVFRGCSCIKYVQHDANDADFDYHFDENKGIVWQDCSHITTVKHIVFGKNVQCITNGLYDESREVKSIVSKNPTPPSVYGAFTNIDKRTCILYVPSESVADYSSVNKWKDFAKIEPFKRVTSVSFDNYLTTITAYETQQLNVTVAPIDASVTDLLWTSSDTNVATISASGEVYGVAPGEAIITAMTVDGSNLKTTCKVKVEGVKAQSIKLSQSAVALEPFQSVTLTYTILPENTSNKSVTWASSDPSIAAIRVNDDASLSVLMLQEGSAIITATTNDSSNLSASCVISDSADIIDNSIDRCIVAVENGAIVIKNGVGTVTIYNTMGIAVATADADGNNVHIDGLNPGVYIVTIADKVVKVMI